MNGKKFQFGFNDLKLTVAGIGEIVGFNDASREYMEHLTGEILDEAAAIADIKAEYRIFNDITFDGKEKSVKIGDQVFFVKTIVFSQIKKASGAALFMCTAGPEIGRRSRKAMQERDLLAGFIYDVIGSEIAETAAELLQNEIKTEANACQLGITNRYSPGYCGWDVAEQHKLFSFFPDNHCGISLTESALMDPVKSVSGIIGIGAGVKINPYTCKMCDMHDCIYRRTREKK